MPKLKLSVKPTDKRGTTPPLLMRRVSKVKDPRGRVPAVGIVTKLRGG